jgi:hypothetical protein
LLEEEAGGIDPVLTRLGGGPRDLEVRLIEHSAIGPFLVIHLIYDVRDAMGANAINTATERLSPRLKRSPGGGCIYASCQTWQTGAWRGPAVRFRWQNWPLVIFRQKPCVTA